MSAHPALPDLDAVLAIIRTVLAEEAVPRFRNLGEADVRAKTGPGDLVTVADEACERRLADALTALMPGSRAVGEEGAERTPALMAHIAGDDPVWVIDPIDGTYNFANGVDRFSSIVALVIGGETQAGWLHNPVTGEAVVGARGQGAWSDDGRRLDLAGQPRATTPADLAQLVGTYSLPPRNAVLRPFAERIRHSLKMHRWIGSGGLDYIELVTGRAQIGLFGSHGRLKPWDHAAGLLLHAEAGGYSALIDGTPYRPGLTVGCVVAAPDPTSWEQVASLLTIEINTEEESASN